MFEAEKKRRVEKIDGGGAGEEVRGGDADNNSGGDGM